MELFKSIESSVQKLLHFVVQVSTQQAGGGLRAFLALSGIFLHPCLWLVSFHARVAFAQFP